MTSYIKSHFENMLHGKRVVVASSASISLYRIPDLIRDIKREGADVISGISSSAAEMLSPEIFKWATGHDVITEISGYIEHISLFDKDTILLIAPASYNTIGKMANGIADNIPSIFFSYAYGHKNPVIVVPAMHKDMMNTSINKENIKKLKETGVLIVEPEYDETKAKLADNDRIIDYICRSVYGSRLKNKNIFILAGKSELNIDPVRVLSNRSTGYTGYWLARNAFRFGADLITYIGNSEYDIPPYVNYVNRVNLKDIIVETDSALEKNRYDYIIMPIALMDFELTESREKLKSSSEQLIRLKPGSKIRDHIRTLAHDSKMVLFNLEGKNEYDTDKFKNSEPDLIVLNSINDNTFGENTKDYVFVYNGNRANFKNIDKAQLSIEIYNYIIDKISN